VTPKAGKRLLAVHSTGAPVICGTTNGPLSFDGNPVTEKGFLALLSATTGDPTWVQSFRFNSAVVAVAKQNATILAGTFGPGTIDIGSQSLATMPTQVDSFVALIPP
jgi:hypothetical protein